MPRRVERFADNGAKNPFFEYSTSYLTTTIPRNFTVLGESLMAPPEGQVTFEVPRHTSFLTLTAHFHAKASPEGMLVTMTPPPPLDTTSGSKAEREVSLFNGTFQSGATTAYVAVLDPNVQYGMGISTTVGPARRVPRKPTSCSRLLLATRLSGMFTPHSNLLTAGARPQTVEAATLPLWLGDQASR